MTDASTSALDAVIFDLGGVLSLSGKQSDLTARFPAEHADTVRHLLMGPYHEDTDHPWHRLERGEITMDEMRRLNRQALEEAGIELPSVPQDANAGTSLGGFRFQLSEPMIALVVRLRDAGLKTGVLTNNIAEFRPMWTQMMDFEALFDDVIDSSAVGMRKPNPAIYRMAVERLGTVPERAAFLDDVQSNVDAAAAVGLVGILVEDDQAAAIEEVLRLTGL